MDGHCRLESHRLAVPQFAAMFLSVVRIRADLLAVALPAAPAAASARSWIYKKLRAPQPLSEAQAKNKKNDPSKA